MDDAPLSTDTVQRHQKHILTMLWQTFASDAWHNFQLLFPDKYNTAQLSFEKFRARFTKPSPLVDRPYRDEAHLIEIVTRHSLPYVPENASEADLVYMENLMALAPITGRLVWDARLQNMIERCGIIHCLGDVLRGRLIAALAPGSVQEEHFFPGSYYRDGLRFSENQLSSIHPSELVGLVEAGVRTYLRLPFAAAKVAALIGWWPYSGYEETQLFDVVMNGFVLLATNGLLGVAIRRNPAVNASTGYVKNYRGMPLNTPERLSTFQCLLTRPVADLFIVGHPRYSTLFARMACDTMTAPYGVAVSHVGSGTYAAVIKYRKAVGADHAGRSEFAVKFQPEAMGQASQTLSKACDSSAGGDLHISKIITDQLSPYDGWIRPSDGTLHASNFVRLLDWQRFIGRIDLLDVEIASKFSPHRERLWQASVYEYAPGSTLYASTEWLSSSASLGSVIVQWLSAMRTMSTACNLTHWDPGRCNCIYGPLKNYAQSLGDCTLMAYRAPTGSNSGDLAVRVDDTKGNIVRIIDYSLSSASSEAHGTFDGIAHDLAMATSYCPRMDVHLFACHLLNALNTRLVGSVYGTDEWRYGQLAVVNAKLLRLIDAMLLPSSSVSHLPLVISSPQEDLTYESYDMMLSVAAKRTGKRGALAQAYCDSLAGLHKALPELADILELHHSQQHKPFQWPRSHTYMEKFYRQLEDCLYLSYHVVVSLAEHHVGVYDTVLALPYFDRYRTLAQTSLVALSTEHIVYMNEM